MPILSKLPRECAAVWWRGGSPLDSHPYRYITSLVFEDGCEGMGLYGLVPADVIQRLGGKSHGRHDHMGRQEGQVEKAPDGRREHGPTWVSLKTWARWGT